MLFSETFNVHKAEADDWFDPVLSLDTKLFLDPFLLYALEDSTFAGSHNTVISFFNDVFALIAHSKGNRASVLWNKAVDLLRFPEVEELCYCKQHGLRLAINSVQTFRNAITYFLEEFKNFVENNDGWRLLWNEDGKPKREEAFPYTAQLPAGDARAARALSGNK